MKLIDIFEEAYFALSSNKIRSGLTMLGIIIGIGSVIAMISVGQGAQGTIQSNIEAIGSNLLIVRPGIQRGIGTQVSSGRGSAQTLIIEDATAIAESVPEANAVAPEVSGRYQILGKGTNTNVSVIGTTPDYTTVRNLEIKEGSFITDQNIKNLSKVAVLGPTVRDDLFGENAENVVGQTVRIKGMEFRIIGITTTKGGGGFGSQDEMVFVPVSSAQKFLTGNDSVSTINVQVTDALVMEWAEENITNLLLERHHISDPQMADFSIMNQSDIIATASNITETLTMLLAAIAGISLLVGGIGIMNMMLTTVTERTREIGLRKAVGAKKKDINLQFLSEAIVLTFSGGALGILLGWIISFIFSYFNILETEISGASVLLAFGVSTFIGIVFGYYPARRASNLNPIEALRYE